MRRPRGHQDPLATQRPVAQRRFDRRDDGSLMLGREAGHDTRRILHADGHKVCGMSDVHGGIYSAKGLDVPSLLAWRREHRSLRGYDGDCEHLTNDQLLVYTLAPTNVPEEQRLAAAESAARRKPMSSAESPLTAPAATMLRPEMGSLRAERAARTRIIRLEVTGRAFEIH